MWGTARPTKAIGPQKAVIEPASRLVLIIITMRPHINIHTHAPRIIFPKQKCIEIFNQKKIYT